MKTKIVATLGPASDTTEMLEKLIKKGVDVFRLNFSHGSQQYHLEVMNRIRESQSKHATSVAILADLQGPKIRLGDFADGEVMLEPGDKIVFTNEACLGTSHKVFISYPSFAADVQVGETILVDDGKMAFKVVETNGEDEALLEAVNGGILLPRKGVNLP
ncbi:MAG: hypothetical protein IT219_06690, partial [Bacteroidales bacterium]|nr:hypothetical protein [Bacteroidales bacterium]